MKFHLPFLRNKDLKLIPHLTHQAYYTFVTSWHFRKVLCNAIPESVFHSCSYLCLSRHQKKLTTAFTTLRESVCFRSNLQVSVRFPDFVSQEKSTSHNMKSSSLQARNSNTKYIDFLPPSNLTCILDMLAGSGLER